MRFPETTNIACFSCNKPGILLGVYFDVTGFPFRAFEFRHPSGSRCLAYFEIDVKRFMGMK